MDQKSQIRDYKTAEKYILSIPKFTTKNSLELTRKFYDFLGRPGEKSKIFHVAGTNGKGSVCAYLHEVLQREGITTGMFTSPHLVTMRERIRVNQGLIEETEFVNIFQKLREEIIRFQVQREEKNYHPAFFELLFFMAMLYFEKRKPQVLILETGMGGRLDATNVVKADKISIITEIGFDHMEYLGDTLEKIAEEKAGIIQPGSRVVYSEKRQETSSVIEKRGRETGALCKSVSKPKNSAISFVDKTIDFSFTSRYYGDIPIQISSVAEYQTENAALALNALEESSLLISKESIREGMRSCFWPARMEEILPGVYLDGAHNEDGIEAFLQTVCRDSCMGKRWIMFSAVADKEFVKMKEMICNSHFFQELYVCCLKNARGLKKEELEQIFFGEKVKMIEGTRECLQEILQLRKEEDMVYIVGSLYLAGEIKEWIEEQ